MALDSAGLGCSVAVAVGDNVLAAEQSKNMHGQAEILLPLIDKAMAHAALPPAALDGIAATVGPGSFTGIRAGLAAARGIALATGARLTGVTSFEAVAASCAHHDLCGAHFLLVSLESRREELYIQLLDPLLNMVTAPATVAPLALGNAVATAIGAAPLLIAGDAARRAMLVLSQRPDTTVFEDSALAAVGALRAVLRDGGLGKVSGGARPLYLRPPDVKLPTGLPTPRSSRE